MVYEDELNFLTDKRGFIEEALSEQHESLDNSDPRAFDDRKMNRFKNDLKNIDSQIEHIKVNLQDLKLQELKEKIIRNKTMHNNV